MSLSCLRYHRQLSRSIYLWGVFTPRDFGCLIVLVAFNTALWGSNAVMLAILAGYPAYLASFRVGRPPGNDVHLFGSLLLPRHLRPGRAGS